MRKTLPVLALLSVFCGTTLAGLADDFQDTFVGNDDSQKVQIPDVVLKGWQGIKHAPEQAVALHGYTQQAAKVLVAEAELQLSVRIRLHLEEILQNNYHALYSQFDLILNAVSSENWQDPVFAEPMSFDALLVAYIEKKIAKEYFLDLYGFVEMVYDQRPGGYLNGTVIERFRPDSSSDKRIRHWKKRVNDDYSGVKPKYLRKALGLTPDHQKYFTRITWSDKPYFLTEDTSFYEEKVKQEKRLKFDYRYLRVLSREAPIAGVIEEDRSSMVFSPFGLMDSYRRVASTLPENERVSIVPTLGAHGMSDVRVMRGNLQHPLQLFHPLANNLLTPHELFSGTLAGRHDYFHIMILSFMPAGIQQAFYKVHDIDQELVAAVNPAGTPASLAVNLAQYDPAFLRGMKLISGQHADDDVELTKIFERLVTLSERDGLFANGLQSHTEYHNSSDDEISDRALDLPFDDMVRRYQVGKGVDFYTRYKDIIFPTSQTYFGYLRFNYQLYRSFRNMGQAGGDKNFHTGANAMGLMSYLVRLANIHNASCTLPNDPGMALSEYYLAIECTNDGSDAKDFNEALEDTENEFLESQLQEKSIKERKEHPDAEGIIRLLRFWAEFSQTEQAASGQ
ncbi:hypothetical protein [Endozoicomonas sp. OPT23]|uniref:hypothetical protein n=1 Tax=Endozoicomonas sp. OPT23 TaxID=2072845 RepID=UPI00129AD1B5|nr:hypothetical protein [Endozoicomonas sp. OPT23]